MNKTTNQIRQDFINFFKKKGHIVLPSSSLIPYNDSTLLFTNAGMNQFKEIFLGEKKRIYPCVTTAQRCLRTGGKHNDLDNVGYTNQHHTFFEMLGNFSFDDYFKKEAITYAWELLTSSEWFNIPTKKIWVSVYEEDEETYHIWKNIIKIPTEKIIKIGDEKNLKYHSDNFWQMGNTGPCGPCTEIFYDCGNDIINNSLDTFQKEKKRFIEIWNIVFIEFNRISKEKIIPLDKKSIDTGMGLERIASILQNVFSNYKIDIFQTLIKSIAQFSEIKNLHHSSFKVIADHIRSCVFILSENIFPSNDSHGYVLRRIIRRALRHGHKIGIHEPFFYKLVPNVIEVMDLSRDISPKKQYNIEKILKTEEIQFSHTLDKGLKLLNKEIKKTKNNILDGEIAFYLYDTLGFPIDLTADVCNEKKIKIDYQRYEEEKEKQKKNSNLKNKFYQNYNYPIIKYKCIFQGYDKEKTQSLIKHIIINNQKTNHLLNGETGIIFLDKTTFYAESGGQKSDIGYLYNQNSFFKVESAKKYGQTIGHLGKLVKGNIKKNDVIYSQINKNYRNKIQLNHSATHLLHSALQKILNPNVVQKGSLVADTHLRFDFSYSKLITLLELQKIEKIINLQIRNNITIQSEMLSLEEAKNKKAMALFNKQYASIVRVISIGNFSIELCGGTHTKKTGNIGLFKIISQSNIASGIKRIEAITGEQAINHLHIKENDVQEISHLLKSKNHNIKEKIQKLILQIHELENTKNKLQEKNNQNTIKKLLKNTKKIYDTQVLIHKFNNYDLSLLRNMIKKIKIEIKKGIIILINITKKNFTIITGVTKNLIYDITAKHIIEKIMQQVEGKGGGKKENAEGGSVNKNLLPLTLKNIESWIHKKIENMNNRKIHDTSGKI